MPLLNSNAASKIRNQRSLQEHIWRTYISNKLEGTLCNCDSWLNDILKEVLQITKIVITSQSLAHTMFWSNPKSYSPSSRYVFFRKETTIFDVEFHLVNLFKIKWLFKVRFYFIYRSGNKHVSSILARRFKKKTNCFWKLRWTYIVWYKSQFSIQTCFSLRKSKKPRGHYRKRLTCYQTNFFDAQ